MKHLIAILFLCLLCDCEKKRNYSAHILFSNKQNDITYFSFNLTPNTTADSKSNLLAKIGKLGQLKQNFKVLKTGKITKETSIVYNAIVNKPEVCQSKSYCYKIKDLADFDKCILSINYASIKSQKRNLKAQVEEIVFDNPTNSQTVFDFINNARNIEYYWNTLDKAPSEMFIEENKLYFIRMRNRNAVYYPKLIANQMKNP